MTTFVTALFKEISSENMVYQSRGKCEIYRDTGVYKTQFGKQSYIIYVFEELFSNTAAQKCQINLSREILHEATEIICKIAK